MSKFENLVLVLVFILMGISVFLFVKFQDNNKLIFIIASLLLIFSISISIWFNYFSKINSLKLSIFMTVITIVFVILNLYILKLIKVIPPYSTLIAIGSARVIADILIKNSAQIENILNKFSVNNK